jgi:hypothetical protein
MRSPPSRSCYIQGTNCFLNSKDFSKAILQNQNRDHDQPDHSLTKLLIYAYISSSLQSLLYLNLKVTSVLQRWTEMLNFYLSKMAILIKILSCLFIITFTCFLWGKWLGLTCWNPWSWAFGLGLWLDSHCKWAHKQDPVLRRINPVSYSFLGGRKRLDGY